MNIERFDGPTLNALSPRHVAAWLRMQGYIHQGSYGDYGNIFVRTKDGEVNAELILPTSSHARDFVRRMAELVNDLADAEDRSAVEVLRDLTMAPFDVVKVRSPDADDYGSVPLNVGIGLHQESMNLVLAAANATASPSPRRSFTGRQFEEVTAYMGSLRLGQSQRGSFILSILSRWDFTSDLQSTLDLGEATFGRRVTKCLAKALVATSLAIRKSVVDGVEPFLQSYKEGVSANLCQALAKLAREGDGIDVAVHWSPSSPERPVDSLSLKREDAAILIEAAAALAGKENKQDYLMEGQIATITEAPDRFDGSAVLETIYGNSVRKVRIKFGQSDRVTIYDAAKNKLWVRVIGDLHREGNRLSLLNPRDIAIVPEDTDDSDLYE